MSDLQNRLSAAADFLEGTQSMRPDDLTPRFVALLREAATEVAGNHYSIESECRRHAAAVRAYTIEECAKVCESTISDPVFYPEYNEGCEDCAAAIRALKTT